MSCDLQATTTHTPNCSRIGRLPLCFVHKVKSGVGHGLIHVPLILLFPVLGVSAEIQLVHWVVTVTHYHKVPCVTCTSAHVSGPTNKIYKSVLYNHRFNSRLPYYFNAIFVSKSSSRLGSRSRSRSGLAGFRLDSCSPWPLSHASPGISAAHIGNSKLSRAVDLADSSYRVGERFS